MIPLRGMNVFPNMVLHFDIGREKSINPFINGLLFREFKVCFCYGIHLRKKFLKSFFSGQRYKIITNYELRIMKKYYFCSVDRKSVV